MISPLEAARAAAGIDLPPHLSHTLVVLALFWPDVRPTQDHLARLLKIQVRGLNKRLATLEQMGRIRRIPGATGRATVYHLNLRKSVSPHTALQSAHQEQLRDGSQTGEPDSVVGDYLEGL